MKRLFCALCASASLSMNSFAAATPRIELRLADVEAAVLARSPALEGALRNAQAGRSRADGQWALLMPRLTLDGSYRYVDELPVVAFGPGPGKPFGAHNNWSVGPTVTWTLWDEGAIRKSWKSQQARARSAEQAAALAGRQARLGARLAYFQLQLALENGRLLGQSLALAQSQYEDIDRRVKAGAASRVDDLSAHQQVLEFRKEYRQTQAELAGALREIFALTESTAAWDLSLPADARTGSLPVYIATPSVSVAVDPLEFRPPELEAAGGAALDPAHPRLRQSSEQAEAARLAAAGLSAGEWPKFQVAGRSDYEYPNGPVLERVQQNTLSLTASLPLFEARKTARDAEEQRNLAAAADAGRRQASDELARDWGKARDQLAALRDQETLDRSSVDETAEVARLVYSAYAAGSRTFLEVQSANLRALQARASAARTQAQISIQLAVLDSLAAKETP